MGIFDNQGAFQGLRQAIGGPINIKFLWFYEEYIGIQSSNLKEYV